MQSSVFRRFVRLSYRFVILAFYQLFVSVNIVGKENLPDPRSGPLILVANHFSVFDVPLIAYWLPIFPTFYTSAELWENRLLAPGLDAMSDDLIRVNRGVVDRGALNRGLTHLRGGGWLMIFPEGGVTPESIAISSAGESTAHVQTG
ncbi:MAG: lysophospholipid acyltransferase family protein, partial [Chloroflexota bacterium]